MKGTTTTTPSGATSSSNGNTRTAGGSGHKIRLRFRILGSNEEEHALSFFTHEKIYSVKEMLEQRIGVHAKYQQLMCENVPLEDGYSIGQYGMIVRDDSVITVVLQNNADMAPISALYDAVPGEAGLNFMQPGLDMGMYQFPYYLLQQQQQLQSLGQYPPPFPVPFQPQQLPGTYYQQGQHLAPLPSDQVAYYPPPNAHYMMHPQSYFRQDETDQNVDPSQQQTQLPQQHQHQHQHPSQQQTSQARAEQSTQHYQPHQHKQQQQPQQQTQAPPQQPQQHSQAQQQQAQPTQLQQSQHPQSQQPQQRAHQQGFYWHDGGSPYPGYGQYGGGGERDLGAFLNYPPQGVTEAYAIPPYAPKRASVAVGASGSSSSQFGGQQSGGVSGEGGIGSSTSRHSSEEHQHNKDRGEKAEAKKPIERKGDRDVHSEQQPMREEMNPQSQQQVQQAQQPPQQQTQQQQTHPQTQQQGKKSSPGVQRVDAINHASAGKDTGSSKPTSTGGLQAQHKYQSWHQLQSEAELQDRHSDRTNDKREQEREQFEESDEEQDEEKMEAQEAESQGEKRQQHQGAPTGRGGSQAVRGRSSAPFVGGGVRGGRGRGVGSKSAYRGSTAVVAPRGGYGYAYRRSYPTQIPFLAPAPAAVYQQHNYHTSPHYPYPIRGNYPFPIRGRGRAYIQPQAGMRGMAYPPRGRGAWRGVWRGTEASPATRGGYYATSGAVSGSMKWERKDRLSKTVPSTTTTTAVAAATTTTQAEQSPKVVSAYSNADHVWVPKKQQAEESNTKSTDTDSKGTTSTKPPASPQAGSEEKHAEKEASDKKTTSTSTSPSTATASHKQHRPQHVSRSVYVPRGHPPTFAAHHPQYGNSTRTRPPLQVGGLNYYHNNTSTPNNNSTYMARRGNPRGYSHYGGGHQPHAPQYWQQPQQQPPRRMEWKEKGSSTQK